MWWSDRRRRARVLAWSAGLACAVGIWGWRSVPVPAGVLEVPGTPRLVDRHGSLLAALPSGEARARFPVPLEAMGEWLPRVTVALEDRRFETHPGVDPRAVAGAAVANARAGSIVRGGSTITQQLVKLGSPPGKRNLRTKAVEAVAALKLERATSKPRILEAYLNRLPYGNRIEGPEAAARWYFAKPASELTLGEAIFLAGIPQAPSRFNPWSQPREAEAKYRRSVARLKAAGFLDATQAEVLLADPPRAGRHVPAVRAPHFVALAAAGRPGHGDGQVRTTLDLRMQETVEGLVRLHLGSLNRHDISNAAVVVIENRTGEVRAMVGSADPVRWQTNAALAPRPAGSVLKPFVYAEAIERRVLTAASLLPDTAEACRDLFPDYQPRNFSPVWHGPVRLREALGNSLNVPAVVALARVGPRRAFERLEAWGLRFPQGFDQYGAGLVLGNAEIRLLDLAGAYAALARGGLAQDPVWVDGARGPLRRVISPEVAAIVADILCDNSARLRSFGPHSVLDLQGRTAVKTGTSSHFRDAWTAGFTADHTVAVWVGNLDGRVMDEVASVDAAAPLWAAVVRAVCGGDSPVAIPREMPGLVTARIDPVTGWLAEEPAPGRSEWFLPGTVPTDRADSMWRETAEGRRLVLPPEYAGWCASGFNRIGAVAAARPEGVEIESPRDGSVYRVSADLSEAQQRIPLRIRAVGDTPVEWKVNGRRIASVGSAAWWAVERGDWEFVAETPQGQLRSRVRVE